MLAGGVGGVAAVPGRPADCSGHCQRHQVRGPGGDRGPEAPLARGAGEKRETHQGAGGDQVTQVCR